MSNSDYLENEGWTSWHDGIWRDPWVGKLWSECDAVDAQRDYDRPGWEQEAERLKQEWAKQDNEEGTEE